MGVPAHQPKWKVLLAFAIIFPVAYAVAIKAVLFDGMRHFIFVLPPIAVVAAVIADRALARLSALPYRAPIYAALGLYGIAHIATMPRSSAAGRVSMTIQSW